VVPAVVLFAMLLGIALISSPRKQQLLDVLQKSINNYESNEPSNAISRPEMISPAQRSKDRTAASFACGVIPASSFDG